MPLKTLNQVLQALIKFKVNLLSEFRFTHLKIISSPNISLDDIFLIGQSIVVVEIGF